MNEKTDKTKKKYPVDKAKGKFQNTTCCKGGILNMKNYYLCDLHFHTNDSFDAFENSGENPINQFDIEKVKLYLKGNDDNVENNVKLVAFTDHNVFNYTHYISNYNSLITDDILCLPGIEINTTNKIHWIFIFDNNELALLTGGKTKGEILMDEINAFYGYDLSLDLLSQAKIEQTKPRDVNKFVDMFNKLNLDYIAIPHFNKDKGYVEAMKKHPEVIDALNLYIKDNIIYSIEGPNCKEFIKNRAEETEKHLEEFIDKLSKVDESTSSEDIAKLQTEILNRQIYLNKVYRIQKAIKDTCQVHGSDFHGKNANVQYVKDDLFVMKSDLSYKGLKFALLDFDSRIYTISEYKKYQKDNNFIVDEIYLLVNGKPITIKLGDALNCIIGSRGSGKTYLLSLLTGDINNYYSTSISKSIKLESIKLTNGKIIHKLDKNMYDYISQRSNSGKKKNDEISEAKFNMYDLLARAPYDYEMVVDKLKNSFSSNSERKINKIDDFFDRMNGIINEYCNLKKYYDDKSVNYNLIKKYNEIKIDNYNNKITRLFNNAQGFLKNRINVFESKIKEIVEFKDTHDNYLKAVKSIISTPSISKLLNDSGFDTEKYSKDTNDLYDIVSTNGLNNLKSRKNNCDLVYGRVQNILKKCNATITNNEKIVNDFASDFRTYVKNTTSILRKIKNNYDLLNSFDLEALINQEIFLFGQESNKLDVRVESKINVKKMTKSDLELIFNNYNKVDDGEDVLYKIFMQNDYGDYFNNNIYDKKDGRKKSYLLEKPNFEKNIFLKADNGEERNWSELSPGERSNMLLNIILLNDCSKILLIDQPEDDLDNETIFNKIVSRLRELKLKRQIIIVTHNANIAITADCDYLVICESKNDGTYELINDTMESASLYDYYSINSVCQDKKQIIDIAAQILDGGKEALSQRVKKIGYKGLFLDKEE